MHGIVLLLHRHRKSSRGTPRLRPAPSSLHGALRLAQPCEVGWDSFPSVLLAATDDSGETELPVAALGRLLLSLQWHPLTMAASVIRLVFGWW